MMLIKDMQITPGLARAISQIVGEHVTARQVGDDLEVVRDDGAELADAERIRLEGVIAAHRAEPFR